jgi:hypothetical protein
MKRNLYLHWIAFILIYTLVSLSCSLTGVATPKPTNPPPSVDGATLSSTSAGEPVTTGDQFVLKMPDGKNINLTLNNCEGLGRYLNIIATNTRDSNDPKRVSVTVSGDNKGAGKYENMYVAIIIGTNDKSVFSGNTSKAKVALEADGSGLFTDEAIVNIANDPLYVYGTPYKFSGQWHCKK